MVPLQKLYISIHMIMPRVPVWMLYLIPFP